MAKEIYSSNANTRSDLPSMVKNLQMCFLCHCPRNGERDKGYPIRCVCECLQNMTRLIKRQLHTEWMQINYCGLEGVYANGVDRN